MKVMLPEQFWVPEQFVFLTDTVLVNGRLLGQVPSVTNMVGGTVVPPLNNHKVNGITAVDVLTATPFANWISVVRSFPTTSHLDLVALQTILYVP